MIEEPLDSFDAGFCGRVASERGQLVPVQCRRIILRHALAICPEFTLWLVANFVALLKALLKE
jgi:hypothetical protein